METRQAHSAPPNGVEVQQAAEKLSLATETPRHRERRNKEGKNFLAFLNDSDAFLLCASVSLWQFHLFNTQVARRSINVPLLTE